MKNGASASFQAPGARMLVLFALVLTLLSSACKHYYYAPNTVNLPDLRKRNDAEISVKKCGGETPNGIEVQAAYSPLKYVGVQVNHFSVKEKDNNGSEFNWGKGHFTEVGLGAYLPRPTYSLSLYGGWGKGEVENHYPNGGFSLISYDRWFVQPGYVVESENFRFGFGYRFSYVQFGNGKIVQLDDANELAILQSIERQSSILLPEFHFNAGMKVSPFILGFNGTWVQQGKASDLHLARNNFSLGLTVDIDEVVQMLK